LTTRAPCGIVIVPPDETFMPAGQSNTQKRKEIKLWVTDLRNRIRRSPRKKTPWPAAPAARKRRPSPPNRPPARKGNFSAFV
jgi:hypothetical protein